MSDYELFAWWGGLNPVIRFCLTLAVLLTGVLILAADGSWVWWVPLVTTGTIMVIAMFEIEDG